MRKSLLIPIFDFWVVVYFILGFFECHTCSCEGVCYFPSGNVSFFFLRYNFISRRTLIRDWVKKIALSLSWNTGQVFISGYCPRHTKYLKKITDNYFGLRYLVVVMVRRSNLYILMPKKLGILIYIFKFLVCVVE